MQEYKIKTMYYDDELHYHIENKKGHLVIGKLTYKEAKFYIDNPEVLKTTIKTHRIAMICVLIFMVIFGIYFFGK